MDNKLPDWEIGKLYNQAWGIIKKYKVLWIFGLATGAGMSFNFNFPINFDFESIKDIQKNFQSFPSETALNNLTQILGASTSKPMELLSYLFSNVPFSFYIILGIEILAVIILFTMIGLIYSAWSQAALLEGIQTSLSNGIVSIRDSSKKAMSSIKPLIFLQILPLLIVIPAFLGIFILAILSFVIPIIILKAILSIILLISIIVAIYYFIYLILSQVWAPRIVVIEKAHAKDALFRGYRIAKKKKWSMILLGLVNIILSGLIIGIPIILILGFIIGGVFASGSNETLGIGLIATGAILIIPVIIGMMIVGGILNAFKATIWSIAYNNIRGKYDGK